nr:hypothetical protein [uncultured Deefgea sp.]
MKKITKPLSAAGVHFMLGGYTLLALFPIVLILINSFKTKAAIFDNPLAFPTAETFFIGGFERVIAKLSAALSASSPNRISCCISVIA